MLEKVFETGLNHDIVFGDVIWKENEKTFLQTFPEKPSFQFFRHGSLGHQSAFIRSDLHNSLGLYDISMKIAADWKFFTTAICKHNVSHKHISLPISICDRNGISCDPANTALIAAEKNTLLTTEFAAFLDDYNRADIEHRELSFLKTDDFISFTISTQKLETGSNDEGKSHSFYFARGYTNRGSFCFALSDAMAKAKYKSSDRCVAA